MKKNVYLALFMVATVSCLQSCKKNKEENIKVDENHKSDIVETSKSFFKDGVSDYKILLPNTNSDYFKNAKEELINLTYEATGFTFEIESDIVTTHNENQKYISLGDTQLFLSTELANLKSDLKKDGTKIITKDNNIYIFAKNDAGILYGVYDFLNIYFDFETFTSTTYKLNKGVKNLNFKEINLLDNPDIEYRQRRGLLNPSTTSHDDKMFAYRMRTLDAYGNLLLPVHSGASKESSYRQEHNSYYYFPQEQYLKTHPNFYGGIGQLCFTAHGNESEYNTMIDLAAEKIEQSLRFYPTAEYPNYVGIELGINDNGNNSMCNCSACTEFKRSHNNSDCAALICFLKKVGKKVNLWMSLKENEPYKRDLSYVFLVYQDTLVPPFENPNAIPDDIKTVGSDVKLVPFVALSGSDLTKKVSASENNKCRGYIENWGKAYPGAWAWCYGGFFNDYLTFFDLYNFYDDYHSYLKENKFSFTFEQVIDMQRGGTTAFFQIADYVLLKKAWNSSLNNNDLIDDFLHNVYGSAYQPMKEMFTQWRLWFAKNALEKRWGEGINQSTATSDWFDIGFLKQMLNIYENAIDAIESFKDDPAVYKKYKDSIDVEYVAIVRPILGYFVDYFTTSEIKDMKNKFKEIVSRLGISRISESEYISGYINSLA